MTHPVFGTAHLFALVPSDGVDALLAAAWDAGFRRFDTAPSYGYGDAEVALGRFLERQDATAVEVTTKVGIVAGARPGRVTKTIKSVARRLPTGVQDRLRGDGVPGGGQFDVTQVRESLERSLARLPRIDRLLLHEATGEDVTDELLACLHGYVERGDVGRLGVATTPERTAAVVARGPAQLVTANISIAPGRPRPVLPPLELVGHGPLGAGGDTLAALQARRRTDTQWAARWDAAVVDTDLRDPADVLLTHAAARDDLAGVIVATSRPQRLPHLFDLVTSAVPLSPVLADLVESAAAQS